MKFKEFEHLGEHDEFFSGLAKVIEKHTGSDKSAWWAERLYVHGIMNGWNFFYSRSQDITALSTLDRAVRDLQRCLEDDAMTGRAQETFFSDLRWGRHLDGGQTERIKSEADQVKKKKPVVDGHVHVDIEESDIELLYSIAERADDIRAAIQRTISDIEKSPLTKGAASKINEQGIRIVDASRFIWSCATGTKAPEKDLNSASKFAKFLADVFEAAGTSGHPRSAFRAWVRERGSWSLDPPE